MSSELEFGVCAIGMPSAEFSVLSLGLEAHFRFLDGHLIGAVATPIFPTITP